MIYLDDAIEAIEEITWHHQNCNNEMVSGANSSEDQPWYKADDVYKALEDVLPAQPEQRWIPCSERLPNLYEYTKNNGLFIVSDGNRSYSEWYDIYDKRRFGESTMSGFRIDYAVTAWMPCPEPYRKDGEADG